MDRLSKDEKEILEALKQQSSFTKRATVSALEACLYDPFPVLDHGFIRVIDYMGDDASIVQAARVSYGKGTKQITQDKALISYLMRHRHTSPFEMNEIKLHIKLPIFIARQWIRHRTANVNEYSARYSILDKEFYLPPHVSPQSTSNRQGRSDLLNEAWSKEILNILKEDSLRLYDHYEIMLNDPEHSAHDPEIPQLARELARMNLSLNYYTQWYWKIDLHNLLHFLSLRADKHAQQEIQDYANVLLDIVKIWCPFVYEAFLEYRKNGLSLSATSVQIIKKRLLGEKVTFEESGLGKREWSELLDIFPELNS